MPIPPNLLSQASNTGVSPRTRTALRKLMTDEFTLNPAFQDPAEQGFSLTGTEPVGGAAAMGRALLGGEAEGTAAAPAERAVPKRPGFYDTTGGQMVKDLLEKRKKLSWLAPDFMANRNERDLNTGIRLAEAEMGGVAGQDISAQEWADRSGRRLEKEASAARWEAEMTAAAEERKQRAKDLEKRRELDERRVSQGDQEIELKRDEFGLRRKESLESQGRQVQTTRSAAQYDPYAENPASTGVFAKFAELAMKDGATPREAATSQVEASRAGVLPPMQSSKRDAPRTAVDPATGRKFWVFPDGRVEPAR